MPPFHFVCSGPHKFTLNKDRGGADRLPQAHTWLDITSTTYIGLIYTSFNTIDLPEYETYDQLRKSLFMAISECAEGFGFV